mgnify:FL=1
MDKNVDIVTRLKFLKDCPKWNVNKIKLLTFRIKMLIWPFFPSFIFYYFPIDTQWMYRIVWWSLLGDIGHSVNWFLFVVQKRIDSLYITKRENSCFTPFQWFFIAILQRFTTILNQVQIVKALRFQAKIVICKFSLCHYVNGWFFIVVLLVVYCV